MGRTTEDYLVSILDDYAEYVLGSGFSGAISQEEAIKEIIKVIDKVKPDARNVRRWMGIDEKDDF